MGLLDKLFKTAATVGGAAATAKVAEKFKENNPEGIRDVNNDGKVDYADYLIEAKKAAKDVFNEAAPEVKEAAEKKISELKEMYPNAVASIDKVVNEVKSSLK